MNDIDYSSDITFQQIMEDPVSFAEINKEALDILYEEASIATNESDYNSPDWDSIHEKVFDTLVDKFWCKFILQYSKLARENKIGEKYELNT